MRAGTGQLRALIRVGVAVAVRPGLWPAAASAVVAHAPARWWARPPFLPLPDRRWLAFRSSAAYGGDGSAPLRVDDTITWLTWRRQLGR